MKRITIKNLVIQFDSNGGNPLAEAQEVIDLMNKIVGRSELEAQPQIMSSGLDASDLEVDDNHESED